MFEDEIKAYGRVTVIRLLRVADRLLANRGPDGGGDPLWDEFKEQLAHAHEVLDVDWHEGSAMKLFPSEEG